MNEFVCARKWQEGKTEAIVLSVVIFSELLNDTGKKLVQVLFVKMLLEPDGERSNLRGWF